MRSVTYSMGMSLDGYIVGPNGGFDWSGPDEETFGFAIDQIREVGVHLLGRRLYETMLYWETADQDPAAADVVLEFARVWQALPKLVFSTTLERVEGNARLIREGAVDEVARLKAQPGKDLEVGGAGLASTLIDAGLVDDYRLFVSPVVLGAGTPYFPALDKRLELELVETRTFASRVVYLRYTPAANEDSS